MITLQKKGFWLVLLSVYFWAGSGCIESTQPKLNSTKNLPGAEQNSYLKEEIFENLQDWCQEEKSRSEKNEIAFFRFSLSDSKISQTLEVCQLSKQKIYFLLTLNGICPRKEFGMAERGDWDPEIGISPNGEAYPALEFIREEQGKSWLAILIEMEKLEFARVEEADYSGNCSFFSGFLPRVFQE